MCPVHHDVRCIDSLNCASHKERIFHSHIRTKKRISPENYQVTKELKPGQSYKFSNITMLMRKTLP
jgi:hypothetical protein